jgi:hypothetical protein
MWLLEGELLNGVYVPVAIIGGAKMGVSLGKIPNKLRSVFCPPQTKHEAAN